MAEYDYDLFVIGAGSGGVRASRMSASYGAKVAVAEERFLGGTCVNVGCVPKKLLVYAAHYSEHFEDAAGFGWKVGKSSFDWKTLIDRKNTEIERLNGIYRRLLANAGVELYESRATIVDPHTVEVGGKRVTAKYILVGVGGWPFVPDIPGKEHVITSNEAFYLETLPKRITVVGGGYIAVEFAGIFHGLGAEVTQLYRGPLFLRGFDADIRGALADEMKKKGIDLRMNADIAEIEKTDSGYLVTLKDGASFETDLVMYATGRAPNTKNLGLKEAGVELAPNGSIKVDDHFRTNVPSIYALGDVIDRVPLTPVAIAEGMCISSNLFRGTDMTMDYENIPTAVFSQPNIGTVGLTEEKARELHGKVDVYASSFRHMKHTLSGREEKTFMKLIVNPEDDRVLGAHMIGDEAGEIMQGLGVALKAGATKADFDATVGIHPTAAEEFVTMREKRPEPEEQPKAAE
jgi:glutathione reductase (NADPH)